MNVFDLGPSRVVVEVPDELTPPGLAIELDVAVFDRPDGSPVVVAGWFTEGGVCLLGNIEVGKA